MKKSVVFAGLGAILVLITGAVLWPEGTISPTREELIAQLEGKECLYKGGHTTISRHTFFSSLSRRYDAEQCIIDAANLLSRTEGLNVDPVPALIEAMKRNQNVQTGDGIVGVRSEIARNLGELGDVRALPALEEILNSEDPVILSTSARMEEGYEIEKGTSFPSVEKAIEMIRGVTREPQVTTIEKTVPTNKHPSATTTAQTDPSVVKFTGHYITRLVEDWERGSNFRGTCEAFAFTDTTYPYWPEYFTTEMQKYEPPTVPLNDVFLNSTSMHPAVGGFILYINTSSLPPALKEKVIGSTETNPITLETRLKTEFGSELRPCKVGVDIVGAQ